MLHLLTGQTAHQGKIADTALNPTARPPQDDPHGTPKPDKPDFQAEFARLPPDVAKAASPEQVPAPDAVKEAGVDPEAGPPDLADGAMSQETPILPEKWPDAERHGAPPDKKKTAHIRAAETDAPSLADGLMLRRSPAPAAEPGQDQASSVPRPEPSTEQVGLRRVQPVEIAQSARRVPDSGHSLQDGKAPPLRQQPVLHSPASAAKPAPASAAKPEMTVPGTDPFPHLTKVAPVAATPVPRPTPAVAVDQAGPRPSPAIHAEPRLSQPAMTGPVDPPNQNVFLAQPSVSVSPQLGSQTSIGKAAAPQDAYAPLPSPDATPRVAATSRQMSGFAGAAHAVRGGQADAPRPETGAAPAPIPPAPGNATATGPTQATPQPPAPTPPSPEGPAATGTTPAPSHPIAPTGNGSTRWPGIPAGPVGPDAADPAAPSPAKGGPTPLNAGQRPAAAPTVVARSIDPGAGFGPARPETAVVRPDAPPTPSPARPLAVATPAMVSVPVTAMTPATPVATAGTPPVVPDPGAPAVPAADNRTAPPAAATVARSAPAIPKTPAPKGPTEPMRATPAREMSAQEPVKDRAFWLADIPAVTGQPAAATLGQSGNPAPPPGLFHHPGLPQHVMRQLSTALRAGPEKAADLLLSPAELGRVRISLVTAETGITVSIFADRPETLDLLRRHADQLAQDFRDIGYDSAAFSFGQGAADDRPAGRNRDADAPERAAPAAPSEPTIPAPATGRAVVTLDRVDIRL